MNSQNITARVFSLDMGYPGTQDMADMNGNTDKHAKGRSKRWAEGLVEQALQRGGSRTTGERAVALVNEMNIAPWVALAISERLITLAEGKLLDAASRCKELPAAVLEARIPVARLQTTMPYASHLLAVELLPLLPTGSWSQRELTKVLHLLLQAEQRRDEQGELLPVRTRAVPEYGNIITHMSKLMGETRCSLSMALDVELGRMPESLVREVAAHRRRLNHEYREQMMQQERRYAFPDRRGGYPEGRAGGWPRRPLGGGPGRRGMGPPRRNSGGGSRAGTPGS